jgi:DNA-binding NarL/FixJ family response regulator
MVPIKVLLADDHLIFSESLSLLIQKIEGVEVVGTAANGEIALDFIQKNEVELILADMKMPVLDGIGLAVLVRERFPHIKIVALTMSDDPAHIKDALQVGISGYVLKDTNLAELEQAIKAVAAGEVFFSEEVLKQLAMLPNAQSTNGREVVGTIRSLTRREIEILRLVVAEHTNVTIGEKLGISSTTVDKHRRNIFKKLNVHSVLGLMRVALRYGLLD